MCGIAGTCRDPRLASGVGAVQRALDLLSHRGPDDTGLEGWDVGGCEVVLGQTRLAIIDLTSGGHQPMATQDGRYALVFNGEIYNYRELRAELESLGRTFSSQSDTEVLLVAWQHWGRECLHRLRGMFAFVVLDNQERTLTCARDPFGIKPFHYTQAGGGFAFASEVPALIDLVDRSFEINHRQAYRFLRLGFYDESAETFIDGIYKLRPGSMMELDLAAGRLSDQERWWWPSVDERQDLSFDQAADAAARTGSRLRRAPHAQRRPARYRLLRGDRLLRHRRGHASRGARCRPQHLLLHRAQLTVRRGAVGRPGERARGRRPAQGGCDVRGVGRTTSTTWCALRASRSPARASMPSTGCFGPLARQASR